MKEFKGITFKDIAEMTPFQVSYLLASINEDRKRQKKEMDKSNRRRR